jgi:hypothetical protein
MNLWPDRSEAITLAAGVDQFRSVFNVPATVHIKTGTTATVYGTCSPGANIDALTADWFPISTVNQAGPAQVKLDTPLTAIRLASAAGGTVFYNRGSGVS